VAKPAVGHIDVVQDPADGRLGGGQLIRIRGEDVYRGAQRFPTLEGDRHHEPPVVTVPVPLLPVLGACADDWRSLLVELWLAVEAVLVNVLVDLPA
jgi:hypothetical protein